MRDTSSTGSRPRWRVRTLVRVGALSLLAALVGCTSAIPAVIREAPAKSIAIPQVQQQPQQYREQRVRWGGTIIAVTNLPATTEVEVLARPLDRDGEPDGQGEGQGRFIAQVAGFLDPAQFEKERSLTVFGTLAGIETRAVGEFRYAYPVVRVETRYLWPKGPPPGAYYPYGYPYGYPGWYDPWGPWFGPGYGPWFGRGWAGQGPNRGYRHRPRPGPGPGRGHWRR